MRVSWLLDPSCLAGNRLEIRKIKKIVRSMTSKSNCLLCQDRRAVVNRRPTHIQFEMLFIQATHGPSQMKDNLKKDQTLIHMQLIINDIKALVILLFMKLPPDVMAPQMIAIILHDFVKHQGHIMSQVAQYKIMPRGNIHKENNFLFRIVWTNISTRRRAMAKGKDIILH